MLEKAQRLNTMVMNRYIARSTCMRIFILAAFISVVSFSQSEVQINKILLNPGKELVHADIYVWRGDLAPSKVLVLAPGCNGNGEGLIKQKVWQDFARKNDLGLVGLSFASDMKFINSDRGYYVMSSGSGQLLLDGIRQAYHRDDLSLLFYGFSGGAHFTGGFVEWKPERVFAWCAYSAGWWSEPKRSAVMPPGVVVCGDEDERLGASLIFFKQGRALGKPWLWIGVPNDGHSPKREVEDFVRDYFEVLLRRLRDPSRDGVWVDVDQKSVVDVKKEPPSLTGWLPEAGLLEKWRKVHQP